jgi:3-dehydroquinate dehydratase-1
VQSTIRIDKKIVTIMKSKICVAIPGTTIKESLVAASQAEEYADVVEIRLDGINKPKLAPFFDLIKRPLLFTNRASWEGGLFPGPEEERVALLQEAINLQAAYIDIELKTDDALKLPLISRAKQNSTATIISWHNFTTTPSPQALSSILQEQFRSGANIGKIVTMANNFSDVLRVLNLQVAAAEIGFPLIAFCMGKPGIISRLATTELGGYMTYAAADNSEATAPGQLPAKKLLHLLEEISLAN